MHTQSCVIVCVTIHFVAIISKLRWENVLRKCVALKIWPFILSHSMYSMECLWFSVYYLIKTTKLLRNLRRCRYTHRYCRQKLCLQWQTNTSERRVTSLSVASMGLFWFQYESTLNYKIMDWAIHTATFCNFDSTEPINHLHIECMHSRRGLGAAAPLD